MLSVNSTEANSKTGKITFMDMAVHPMNVLMAEKITNDILPIYGENLKGSFEDVRIPDTVLELKEQEVYATTHTVNETREKFYNDKPLTDERGDLFPGEVGTGSVQADVQLDDGGGSETQDLVAKMLNGMKESERRQYKNYVKARKKGDGFKFEYLTEDEQTVLKAETMGIDALTNYIDDMRKAV